MKMPIDVKEVLDAATDIDAARKIPVSVAVFFDKSAPADLQDCVRSAFAATGSTYTRVLLGSYPALTAALEPGTDVAVLVAGLDESTGMLAQSIRQAGTPVMVVTTMPELVKQIAQTAGYPLWWTTSSPPTWNRIPEFWPPMRISTRNRIRCRWIAPIRCF